MQLNLTSILVLVGFACLGFLAGWYESREHMLKKLRKVEANKYRKAKWGEIDD